MVGAPLGKFPGGISGIEVDSLACAESLGTTDELILNATTQEERMACLANITTGLVYLCKLNESDCGPILGNGIARSPDGYLFDRIGEISNIIIIIIIICVYYHNNVWTIILCANNNNVSRIIDS